MQPFIRIHCEDCGSPLVNIKTADERFTNPKHNDICICPTCESIQKLTDEYTAIHLTRREIEEIKKTVIWDQIYMVFFHDSVL